MLNPHGEPASHRYAGPEPRYRYSSVSTPSWIRSKGKAFLGDLEYDLVVDPVYLVWRMEISCRDQLESSPDTFTWRLWQVASAPAFFRYVRLYMFYHSRLTCHEGMTILDLYQHHGHRRYEWVMARPRLVPDSSTRTYCTCIRSCRNRRESYRPLKTPPNPFREPTAIGHVWALGVSTCIKIHL